MVVVAGTMAGGTQVIDGFHGWSEGTMETRNGNLSSKHDSVDGTRFQTWHSQVWWNYQELSKHLVTIPLEKTHGYMTSTNFGEMYNFHGERKDYQINYQMVRKKWMGWCSPCDTYPNILHIPENFLEILPGFFHPSKRSKKKMMFNWSSFYLGCCQLSIFFWWTSNISILRRTKMVSPGPMGNPHFRQGGSAGP